MRIEGRHEWLQLVVVWPMSEEEAGDVAIAISRTVFGDNMAGEIENQIRIPRTIGDVILHEGHVLEAYGNTGAHNGSEVEPTDLTFQID